MTRFLFLVTLVSIIALNFSCKKTITGPEQDIPGRRDYVWSVDTISTDPFVYIRRFWGSSPDDMWAVGGYLFHYDGIKWTEIKPDIQVYPEVIFGFSQNNIWAAGYSNIWHFDGSAWSLDSQINLDGYSQVYFDDNWGNTTNNVYAVGYGDRNDGDYKGVILHYDGTKWDFINIPVMKINFTNIKIVDSKLIAAGLVNDNYNITMKIFDYDGTSFKELYSGSDVPTLTVLQNNLFIQIGTKIFKYYQGSLVPFIDFSQTEYVGGFWGRTEKDFFCVTQNGLGHYNGTDLVTIYPFDIKKLSPFSGLFFNDEVFFLGRDEQANISIIIKGKLAN